MNSDKTQRQEQQLHKQWFQELQDKLFREYAQQQQREELARLNGRKRAEFERLVSEREKSKLIQARVDSLKEKYGKEMLAEANDRHDKLLKQSPQAQSSLTQEYLDFKQRENADLQDKKRSSEQGLLGTKTPDSPSDFKAWYYAGKASDELQASLGIVPPRNLTPAGAVWQIQFERDCKRLQVEKIVEAKKQHLEKAGFSPEEISRSENAIYQQAYAHVGEEWKKESTSALKAWQDSLAEKSLQDFKSQGDSVERHTTVPDSLKAKLEAQRKKYGTTTEHQQSKSQSGEIER
jgi:hypothetical protein